MPRGKALTVNTTHLILPGGRFFDPMARALMEQRQWLLWSKDNADRTTQMIRAISHRPDDVFRSEDRILTDARDFATLGDANRV